MTEALAPGLALVLSTSLVSPASAVSADAARARSLSEPAGTTTVEPSTTPGGAAPRLLHERRETIHAGQKHLRVQVPKAKRTGDTRILGRTPGGYLVGSSHVPSAEKATYTIWRVRAGARAKPVRTFRAGPVGDVATNPRGTRVAVAVDRPRFQGVLVLDARTGRTLLRRRLGGMVTLEHFGGRLLVSQFEPERTVWLHPGTGRLERVAKKRSLWLGRGLVTREERATSPTGYPCLRVVRMKRPQQPLWRSCDLSPIALSPDGEHLLVGPNADAPTTGPTELEIRTLDGNDLVRRFVTAQGPASGFSDFRWERAGRVLLTTQDAEKAAVVRCGLQGTCRRATPAVKATGVPARRLHISFP